MTVLVKCIHACYIKRGFFLLYLFSNVELELIYFIKLVSQHKTVARYFKSSNRNTIGV